MMTRIIVCMCVCLYVQLTREEVNAILDAKTAYPDAYFDGNSTTGGFGHTTTTSSSSGRMLNATTGAAVYDVMDLLRQWGLDFCGLTNLGGWSTGTTAGGNNAGKLTCSGGAWTGFSQYGCLDSLTSPVDIVYGKVVQRSASPSEIHNFNDDNCGSANPITRSTTQKITTTNNYAWSNTVGLVTSASMEISAGVPGIIDVKDSFSIQLSTSTTTSNRKTEEDEQDVSSSYTIPGHSRESLSIIFSKTSYNLSYTSVLQMNGFAAVFCNNKVNGHNFWFVPAASLLPSYSNDQITCTGGSSNQCSIPGVFQAVAGNDYSTKATSSKC